MTAQLTKVKKGVQQVREGAAGVQNAVHLIGDLLSLRRLLDGRQKYVSGALERSQGL